MLKEGQKRSQLYGSVTGRPPLPSLRQAVLVDGPEGFNGEDLLLPLPPPLEPFWSSLPSLLSFSLSLSHCLSFSLSISLSLMASISGICSSSSALKSHKIFPPVCAGGKTIRGGKWAPLPMVGGAARQRGGLLRSVARDTPPADVAAPAAASTPLEKKQRSRAGVEKDPAVLWRRYVDWLYQNKELGLFLDVSRIGFTDEFFEWMEPKLQKAFADMRELEKGAIANPDEGRMVGHYWLRNPELSPTTFLRFQIQSTLDMICEFAGKVINGEVGLLFLSLPFFCCHHSLHLSLLRIVSCFLRIPFSRDPLAHI